MGSESSEKDLTKEKVIVLKMTELSKSDLEVSVHVAPIELPTVQIPVLNFFSRYKGMFLALVSSVMFSLSALLVKFLKSYHPITIALWRIQGAFLPSIFILIWKEVKYRRRRRKKSHTDNSTSALRSVWPWTDKDKMKLSVLVLVHNSIN